MSQETETEKQPNEAEQVPSVEQNNTDVGSPPTEQAVDTPVQQGRLAAVRAMLTKHTVVFIVLGVLVLGGAVAAVIFANKREQQKQTGSTPTTQAKTEVPDVETKPEAKPILLSGNTFLSAPQRLADLGMFKNPVGAFGMCDDKPCVTADDIHYDKVGTTKDGEDIVVASFDYGPGGTYFLLIGKDGTYTVAGEGASGEDLNEGFAIDKNLAISDFTFPSSKSLNGQTFKNNGYSHPLMNGLDHMGGMFDGDSFNRTKITSDGVYDFYRVVSKDEPTFQVVNMYGAIKAVWAASYTIDFADVHTDKKQPVVWADGSTNGVHYFSGGQGCGSEGYVIAKGVRDSDLVKVGALGDASVYQLSTSHALVKEIFAKDYQPAPENFDDKSLANLTIDQFTAKRAYVIMKNKLGEYMVLQRTDMFMRGGCAKPVVYLYPTRPTKVDVQVGAAVAISEPQYEKDGWQDVLAQPTGELTYRGKRYGSLFWEGYGSGAYPAVTTGTVVRSGDAPRVLREQLAKQGLNSTEIADFMAFWEPKLPQTPYTRISWLGKAQLDALAPLSVNPRPDTVIRVFVDFEGLQAYQTMAPSQLRAPKRTGFTVVEWGGLARTGL